MKKSLATLILAFLFAFNATAETVYQQFPNWEVIVLNSVQSPNWYPIFHPVKKTPDEVLTPPSVFFCNESAELVFSGIDDYLCFTYYVINEAEEVVASEEISLYGNLEETVSLSSLPSGAYTIIISIADRYYEGHVRI